MVNWIKKELGLFLTVILLMVSGGVIGGFVAKYKLDLQHAEDILYYQEELYEVGIELTEAESYLKYYEELFENQEDFYEMKISMISANYRLQIEYIENSLGVTSEDLEIYNQLVDMFGSLTEFLNFLMGYEYRVMRDGYISIDDYYYDYWNN